MLALALFGSPALCDCGGPYGIHPSNGWGPAHGWGADADSPCALGGCKGPSGRPHGTVNTFTGNLTITDMPASYFQVGDAIPFELFYNSQANRLTGLDHLYGRWTHSYDTFIKNDAPSGVTIYEGNGWVHTYAGNPAPSSPGYASPPGVYDVLLRTYDANNNPIGWRLTRLDHSVLNFSNDMNGNGSLSTITDRNGLTWSLAYIQYTNPGTHVTYNLLSTISDPLRNVTTLHWGVDGTLQSVTGSGGTVTIGYGTYLGGYLINSITDASGMTYSFDYWDSTQGLIGSISAGMAYKVQYSYATVNGRTVVSAVCLQNKPSSNTTFTYGNGTCDITDAKGTLHQVYDSSGSSTEGALLSETQDPGGLNLTHAWAYDSSLNVKGYRDSYQPETGGKAHRHFFFYNDPNNPSFVTKYIDPQSSDANPSDTGNPSQNCPGYTFTYDSYGNLTHAATPTGRSMDIVYTSNTPRPTTVTIHDADINNNPVDHVTHFTYYGANKGYQVQTVTDDRGNVTSFDYDITNSNWALPKSVTAPGNRTWTFTPYATHSDIQTITDPYGNQTGYTYDALHKPNQIFFASIGNGTPMVALVRSCCGLGTFTDENGIITASNYDPNSQQLDSTVEDSGGANQATSQYNYDGVGNCTLVSDALGNSTNYTYDAASRLTRVDYFDGTYETWTYHDDGRVASHTDGRGRTTNFHYDADDRLCSVGTTAAIVYPTDTAVNITRDADGLITSFTDAVGTTSSSIIPAAW